MADIIAKQISHSIWDAVAPETLSSFLEEMREFPKEELFIIPELKVEDWARFSFKDIVIGNFELYREVLKGRSTKNANSIKSILPVIGPLIDKVNNKELPQMVLSVAECSTASVWDQSRLIVIYDYWTKDTEGMPYAERIGESSQLHDIVKVLKDTINEKINRTLANNLFYIYSPSLVQGSRSDQLELMYYAKQGLNHNNLTFSMGTISRNASLHSTHKIRVIGEEYIPF